MNLEGKLRAIPLWRAAALSFTAMCLQDIVGTGMVIYESRYQIVASGLCDVLQFLAGLICSSMALESIINDGWRTKRSLCLIGIITAANFVGTAVGVILVKRLTHG